MSGLRTRPRDARTWSFGFFLLAFGFCPDTTGYQDLGALLAQQPGVVERWQKQVLLPSIGAVQVATFNFARPIGTSLPPTAYERFVNHDNQQLDVTGSIARNPLGQIIRRLQRSDFPTVNREHKSDRLPLVPQIQIVAPADVLLPPAVLPAADAPAAASPPVPADRRGVASADPSPDALTADQAATVKETSQGESAATPQQLDPELQAALDDTPLPSNEISMSLEDHPFAKPGERVGDASATEDHAGDFAMQTARLYFGQTSLGIAAGTLERWQPGAAPQIIPGHDPDMKTGRLDPDAAAEGTSVAGKGEVTGEDRHPKSPAERLGLAGKARAKAEKCLAEAVYFEARGEKVRGQIAVAQVVMNRVFSGFYPNNVCSVVYQNKNRHLACQFTFACDNVADVVREPDMWDRARRIAKAMLDGQLWLPEVAKSTHYHAYWVHPSWVHEMRKMYKYGVHTFYRPRAWGDGSDAPSWGTPAQTAAISAELAADKD
jgi:spore germination cell wall hydrolase CwlJ-like protein